MRGSLGASDSALVVTRALALTLTFAFGSMGCPYAAQRTRPERKAPPRVLVVRLDHVALRASAWVELHSWLAASARAQREIGDPELDAAARGYASVLASGDRDEALTQSLRATEACDDETCARAAVAGSPFASAYLAALPRFLARHWQDRAEISRATMEVARASMGEQAEAMTLRLAKDLAIDWPAAPLPVDVVVEAPEPGRDAPIGVLLAAQGSCFATRRNESARLRDARVVDCVLAYSALRLEGRSSLAAALRRELSARGRASDLARAWTALVTHAVATVVSGLEPKHVSVPRRSVAAIMPGIMSWLAREWPKRMQGEPAEELAKRYAAELDAPETPDRPSR